MPCCRPRTGLPPGPWPSVLLALTLALLVPADKPPSSKPAKPNIIFVLADDMGWNDIGFHGGEMITPNLDALAYQGIVANKLYTPPICTPTRAAIFTGKYPSHTGMQGAPPIGSGRAVALPKTEKIIPEYLKELGYSTHLVGKWHLGCYRRDLTPTRRGFDSHFGYWNGYIGHYDGVHAIRVRGPTGIDFHRNFDTVWNETHGQYITPVLTEEACKLIKNHGRKDGFFLMVTHLAPHTGNPGPTLMQQPTQTIGPRRQRIRHPVRRLNADMLKEIDESMGKLVQALSDEDMLSNTVIIFMSDNGAPSNDPIYNFANGGSNWPLRGEKVSAHEGGTRVPALIWSPLIKRPGRVHNGLMHSCDWLPTLVSAAGGKVDRELDGVDQWEALAGPEESRPPREDVLVDYNAESEALIYKNFKLIKNFPEGSQFAPADEYTGESGRGLWWYNTSEVWNSEAGVAARRVQKYSASEETYLKLRREATVECGKYQSGPGVACNPEPCLFDLDADPCEKQNLAPARPELVAKLDAMLDPYRASAKPKLEGEFDPRADPACWGNEWTTWLEPGFEALSTCHIADSEPPSKPDWLQSFLSDYISEWNSPQVSYVGFLNGRISSAYKLAKHVAAPSHVM